MHCDTLKQQSTRRPLMILALTYWLSIFATYVSMMQSNILLLLCFMRRASCVVRSITRMADFCCCNVCCSEVVVAAYPRFWDWVYRISRQLLDLGRATAYTLCDWHRAKIPNSRDSVPESGYNGSIAEASRDSWNRVITAQCEGMGEVGSARYEPALLPPCPSIRALCYSNCQRSTQSHQQSKG